MEGCGNPCAWGSLFHPDRALVINAASFKRLCLPAGRMQIVKWEFAMLTKSWGRASEKNNCKQTWPNPLLLRRFTASQGGQSRESENNSTFWGRSVGKGHLIFQRDLLAALQDPEDSHSHDGVVHHRGFCLPCFLLTFAFTLDTILAFLLNSGIPLARCTAKV